MALRRWLVEQDRRRRLFIRYVARGNWILSPTEQLELTKQIVEMWAYNLDFTPVVFTQFVPATQHQVNIHWRSFNKRFRGETHLPGPDSSMSAGAKPMRLNTHPDVPWDLLLFKKTISHEFGHAIGLGHYGEEGQEDDFVMDGDLGSNRLYVPRPGDLNQGGKRYGFKRGKDVFSPIPDLTNGNTTPPNPGPPNPPPVPGPGPSPPDPTSPTNIQATIVVPSVGTYSGSLNRSER